MENEGGKGQDEAAKSLPLNLKKGKGLAFSLCLPASKEGGEGRRRGALGLARIETASLSGQNST